MSKRGTTILDFYRGAYTPEGHTFYSVLAMTDRELEYHHDYIQWLFPTFKPSRFSDAPTLTETEARILQSDPECQQKLIAALDRMLAFWKFRREGDLILIDGIPPVLREQNHNWLRMTRVIDCLRTMGREELARSLCDALVGVPGTEASRPFWKEAAYGTR
jgi:hypothetical protein